MKISGAELRSSTKGLLAAVTSGGALFQIPEVHDFLIALAHNHPHVVGAIGTLTGIAGLLHMPQVQDVLGIRRTVTVETEEVAVVQPEAKP